VPCWGAGGLRILLLLLLSLLLLLQSFPSRSANQSFRSCAELPFARFNPSLSLLVVATVASFQNW
jgi:hypothetical protein